MYKPIIGVISNRTIEEKNRPFTNKTSFSNLICEKIYGMGGNPIGIVFPYNRFDPETLYLCDGFVFQGGSLIESSQIIAMNYCFEEGKPVLAICNGMQTMAGTEFVRNNVYETTNYNIRRFIKYNPDSFLELVDNHNKENPFYIENIENAKHEILIKKYSRLYELTQKRKQNVVSVHNYKVKDEILSSSKDLFVSARSKDGVIEAIESVDPKYFYIGLQYHIELDNENNIIFKEFIKESNKRILKK